MLGFELEPRVYRLTLESEHAEDTFVHAVEWFAANESLQLNLGREVPLRWGSRC